MVVPALPFPDPPLSDDTITLRPTHGSDVQRTFAGFSDPLWLRFCWALTELLTQDHVLRLFDEQKQLHGQEVDFVTASTADLDDVRGGASVYAVDRDESRAAVGYWLAPNARGRGIATRTLRLLARWAFDHLAIAHLELTCAPDNTAAQRIAERCGFVREGVQRSHTASKGARRDTMIFTLLPGERH